MLSEWMLERPERFEEDWLVVLAPVGKRCLVVGYRGVGGCGYLLVGGAILWGVGLSCGGWGYLVRGRTV